MRSVVFDCNVFLQAMISRHGPAAGCLAAVFSHQLELVVAPFVFAETLRLPNHPDLRRFRHLTPQRVETVIVELLEVANLMPDPPRRFELPRDPDDARYVDLALAAASSHLVTNDRDLLDLGSVQQPFTGMATGPRELRIVTPAEMLREIRAAS